MNFKKAMMLFLGTSISFLSLLSCDAKAISSDVAKAINMSDRGEVERLLKLPGKNDPDEHGRTPLMYACAKGRTGIVQSILRSFGCEKMIDSDGNDVWRYAQYSNEPAIMQLLRNYAVPHPTVGRDFTSDDNARFQSVVSDWIGGFVDDSSSVLRSLSGLHSTFTSVPTGDALRCALDAFIHDVRPFEFSGSSISRDLYSDAYAIGARYDANCAILYLCFRCLPFREEIREEQKIIIATKGLDIFRRQVLAGQDIIYACHYAEASVYLVVSGYCSLDPVSLNAISKDCADLMMDSTLPFGVAIKKAIRDHYSDGVCGCVLNPIYGIFDRLTMILNTTNQTVEHADQLVQILMSGGEEALKILKTVHDIINSGGEEAVEILRTIHSITDDAHHTVHGLTRDEAIEIIHKLMTPALDSILRTAKDIARDSLKIYLDGTHDTRMVESVCKGASFLIPGLLGGCSIQ